jgi:hypothetical protein
VSANNQAFIERGFDWLADRSGGDHYPPGECPQSFERYTANKDGMQDAMGDEIDGGAVRPCEMITMRTHRQPISDRSAGRTPPIPLRCVALAMVALLDAPWAGAEGAPPWRATRVVLIGDSLAQETADTIRWFTGPKAFASKYWPGTAPCDYAKEAFPEMDQSTVVVLQFSGNSFGPCMSDGSGGQLAGDALVAMYRVDVTSMVRRVRSTGARVLLVGQPYHAPGRRTDGVIDGLNALYRELAVQPMVGFVDAAAAVTEHGQYTATLPCIPGEPVCGESGRNVVRGDGVHFCPIASSPCPVWSSGAFRYGAAIATAVNGFSANE